MDFLSEAKRWAEQQGLKAALIDVSSRLRSASTSLQSNLLESSSTTEVSSSSSLYSSSPSKGGLSSSSSLYLGSMDTPYLLSYQQPIPGKPLSIPSVIEPNLRNMIDNFNDSLNTSHTATTSTTVGPSSPSSALSVNNNNNTGNNDATPPPPNNIETYASPLRTVIRTEHIASVNSKVPVDRTPQITTSSVQVTPSMSTIVGGGNSNVQRTPPSSASLSISYPLNSSTRIISTPLTRDSTIHGPSMQVPHLVNANIVGDEDGGVLLNRIRELESQQFIFTQTLADARARAATAETRCITLETALERYAAQGASLEGQIEGLGTAMRQELSKMALEVEAATARAIAAETTLDEMKQIENNLRTEAANAAREAASVMDSFREQAEAAFAKEQAVTAEVQKQVEILQNELKVSKAQTAAAENKAIESASDASISQREAAAAREMAVTAEAHLAASQRELDRLRHEVAELTTRLITANTNNTVNNIVNLPPLPISNPPSLNNSFASAVSLVPSGGVNSSVVVSNLTNQPTTDNQNQITPFIHSASFPSLWPLRKVVFLVHGTDTPTLLPLPPIDESVAVKVEGTGAVIITDNDVQRICPASKAMDSTSLAVSTRTNTDPNIEEISKLVHAGLEGRSGTIFIANAPSLGDIPLHQCITSTAKEIFSQLSQLENTVVQNRANQSMNIQHKIKISIIEVCLDHALSTKGTSKECIRDILDVQQITESTDSSFGRLYAPILPLEISNDNSNDTLIPITSRALNIDVDTIEGIDALVEMALIQRAALRAQETPSTATTLEMAALTNRSHVIVTFAINHLARTETKASESLSSVPSTTQFTSRLHIVQLACPAHIGLVSQAGTMNEINYAASENGTDNSMYNEPLSTRLSNEIVDIAKSETLFATNALQTLSNVWIKLSKTNTTGHSNELMNRLALDTIANESTITTVIADALSPSCGHLFCVHVPPRLSYTLDADAVAFFMAGSDMYDAIPLPVSVTVPPINPFPSTVNTQTIINNNANVPRPSYPQSEASRVAEIAAATVATTVSAQQVLGRRNSNVSSVHSLPSKVAPSITSVWTSSGPTIIDLDESIKYMDSASVRRANRQFSSVDNRSNIGTGLTARNEQQRRRSTSSTGSRTSLSNTNSYIPTIEEYIRSGGPEKAKHIVAAELDTLARNSTTTQTKRSTSTGKASKKTPASTTLSQLLSRTTRDNDTASIGSVSHRSSTNTDNFRSNQRRRSRSEERKAGNAGNNANTIPTVTMVHPTVTAQETNRSVSGNKKRSSSVSSKNNKPKEYLSLEEHMQQAMNKHLGRTTTISLGERSRTGLVLSNTVHKSTTGSKVENGKGNATKIIAGTTEDNNTKDTLNSATSALKTITTSRNVLSDLDTAIANEIQETLRLEQSSFQTSIPTAAATKLSPSKSVTQLQKSISLPLSDLITSTSTTNNASYSSSSSVASSSPLTIPLTNSTLPATRRSVQPPSPPSLPKTLPQPSMSTTMMNTTNGSVFIAPSEPTNPVPAMRQLLFYAKAYFHQYSSLPEPFRLIPSHFDQLRAYLVSVAIDNRGNTDNSDPNSNGNIFINSNSFTLAIHKWIPSLSINQIYTLLELMGLNNVLTNTIDVMDFVDALEALANGEGY